MNSKPELDLWEVLFVLFKRIGGGILFYILLASVSYLLFKARYKLQNLNSLWLSKLWVFRKKKRLLKDNPLLDYIQELILSIDKDDLEIEDLTKRKLFKQLIERDMATDTLWIHGIAWHLVNNYLNLSVPTLQNYIFESFNQHVIDSEEIILSTLTDDIPTSAIEYFIRKRSKLKNRKIDRLIFQLRYDTRKSLKLVINDYIDKMKFIYFNYIFALATLWNEANGELDGSPCYLKYSGRLIRSYKFGRLLFDERHGILVCLFDRMPYSSLESILKELIEARNLLDAKKILLEVKEYGALPEHIIEHWEKWGSSIKEYGLRFIVFSFPTERFTYKGVRIITKLLRNKGIIARIATPQDGLSWLIQSDKLYKSKCEFK